ncbi:hypothetical protein WDU94_006136 [Cyamophila willieti]
MVCLDILISVTFVLVSFAIDGADNVPIIQQYTQSFNSKLDPVSETIGSELHHLPHQRRLVAPLIPAGDLSSPTDPTRPHHKAPILATARSNEKSAPVRGKPISSQHPKRHEDGKHGDTNSNPKLAKLTEPATLGEAKRNTEAARNATKTVIGNTQNSSNKNTEKLSSRTRTGKELVNTQLKLLPSSPKLRGNVPPPPLNPHEGILHLSHKFAELFPNSFIVRPSRHSLRITPEEVVQKIPSNKSDEEESEVFSNVQKIDRKTTEDPDETVIEVYRIEDDLERTGKNVDRILEEFNRRLNLDELLGNKVKVRKDGDEIKRSSVDLNDQIDLNVDFLTTKLKVPIIKGRDDDDDDGGDLEERMSNDMMVEKLEEELMLDLDQNMKSNETDSENKDGVEDEDTESIMHKLRHTDVFAIIYLGGFIGLVTFFFILACSEIFCQNCLYRSSSNLFLPQAHCTHSYYTTPKPVTPPPPYHLFAPPPYMDIAKAVNNVSQSAKTVSHTILHIEASERNKSSTNGTPCVCPGTPCPPYSRDQTGVSQGSHISPLVSVISLEEQSCPPYQGSPVSLHKTTNSTSVHVENERNKTGFQQYNTVKHQGEPIYEVHRIPSKPIPCCKYDGTTDTIIKSSPNTGDHTVRHCVSFIECSDNRQVNTYRFKNSVSFSEQTGLTSSTESKMNEIERLALANFLRENRQFKNQLKTRIRNSLSFTSNHSVEMEDPGVKHSVSYAEHMDNACRTLDELEDKVYLGKQHCRSCIAISSLHSSIPEFRTMSIDKPLVDFSNVHTDKHHQRTQNGGDLFSNRAGPHQSTEIGVDNSNQNDKDIRNQSNKETLTGNLLYQSTENGVDIGSHTNKRLLTDDLLNTSLMKLDKDTRTEQTNIRHDDNNLIKQKTVLDTNTNIARDVSTNTCQGFVNQMGSLVETNKFVNQMNSITETKPDCIESKILTKNQMDFVGETQANFMHSDRVKGNIYNSLKDHNSSVDTLTFMTETNKSTERPLENHNTSVNTLGYTERTLIDHSTSEDETHMKDTQPQIYSNNSVDYMKESNSSHIMNFDRGHCALTSGKDSGNSPGISMGKTEDRGNATGICIGKTEESKERGNSRGVPNTGDKGSADRKNLKTKIFFIDDLDDEEFS